MLSYICISWIGFIKMIKTDVCTVKIGARIFKRCINMGLYKDMIGNAVKILVSLRKNKIQMEKIKVQQLTTLVFVFDKSDNIKACSNLVNQNSPYFLKAWVTSPEYSCLWWNLVHLLKYRLKIKFLYLYIPISCHFIPLLVKSTTHGNLNIFIPLPTFLTFVLTILHIRHDQLINKM